MDIVQLFPTAYLLDRLRLTHVSLYIKNWNPVRTFQHLSLGFYSFFKLLLCSLSIQIGLEPTSPITVTLLSDPNLIFGTADRIRTCEGIMSPTTLKVLWPQPLVDCSIYGFTDNQKLYKGAFLFGVYRSMMITINAITISPQHLTSEMSFCTY